MAKVRIRVEQTIHFLRIVELSDREIELLKRTADRGGCELDELLIDPDGDFDDADLIRPEDIQIHIENSEGEWVWAWDQ